MDKLSKLDCDNLQLEIDLHTGMDHPHIIKFHESRRVGNKVYLLLELAENNSLFFYIHSQHGLPEPLALRFFYETALAMKYLHDRGIIHRDIKPENILICSDYSAKICDFGWSCRLEHEFEARTSICGTYEYMSPEILNQGTHSLKTDIWCLGILLYEMLNGTPPHKANSFAQMRFESKSKPIYLSTKISPVTRDLMSLMLQTDEDRRINIDQVLEHPAITANVFYFHLPLAPAELAILRNNYNFNTNAHIAQLIAQIDDLIYRGPYKAETEVPIEQISERHEPDLAGAYLAKEFGNSFDDNRIGVKLKITTENNYMSQPTSFDLASPAAERFPPQTTFYQPQTYTQPQMTVLQPTVFRDVTNCFKPKDLTSISEFKPVPKMAEMKKIVMRTSKELLPPAKTVMSFASQRIAIVREPSRTRTETTLPVRALVDTESTFVSRETIRIVYKPTALTSMSMPPARTQHPLLEPIMPKKSARKSNRSQRSKKKKPNKSKTGRTEKPKVETAEIGVQTDEAELDAMEEFDQPRHLVIDMNESPQSKERLSSEAPSKQEAISTNFPSQETSPPSATFAVSKQPLQPVSLFNINTLDLVPNQAPIPRLKENYLPLEEGVAVSERIQVPTKLYAKLKMLEILNKVSDRSKERCSNVTKIVCQAAAPRAPATQRCVRINLDYLSSFGKH